MATKFWATGYPTASPSTSEWGDWIVNFETYGLPAGIDIGCMVKANPFDYTPAICGAILERARDIGMAAAPMLVMRLEMAPNNTAAFSNFYSVSNWENRVELVEDLVPYLDPVNRILHLDIEIFTQSVKSQMNLGNGNYWDQIPDAMIDSGFLDCIRENNITLMVSPATEQAWWTWYWRCLLGTHFWADESSYGLSHEYAELTAGTAADFAEYCQERADEATRWGAMKTWYAMGLYQSCLRAYCANFRQAIAAGVDNCFVFFKEAGSRTGFGTPAWFADTTGAAEGLSITLTDSARLALAATALETLRSAVATNQAIPGPAAVATAERAQGSYWL